MPTLGPIRSGSRASRSGLASQPSRVRLSGIDWMVLVRGGDLFGLLTRRLLPLAASSPSKRLVRGALLCALPSAEHSEPARLSCGSPAGRRHMERTYPGECGCPALIARQWG